MRFRLVFTFLLLLSLTLMTGCSALAPGDSPSSKVLSDVRFAETGYLTAITIINVRAANDHKPISPDVLEAENLIFSYIEAAKEAAQKGDTVTVEQKLDLFNEALKRFNDKYTNAPK